MKRILVSLFVTISLVTSAQNTWENPNASRVVTDSIYSEILGAWRQYNIYLPENYNVNPEKKYPIVYLLHGVMDTHEGWFNRGHVQEVADPLIASGEAVPMLIVTPNAGGNPMTEWNGYINMPGWNYEDFFFQEFIPKIEEKYRAYGDKQHRAIGGLSMGGGGSTYYAMHHPDMFSSLYAMSALMSVPSWNTNPTPDDPNSKMALLTKAVMDNDNVEYVLAADEARKNDLRTVTWFVDCGDDDFLLDCNLAYYQAMRNSGIPCQLRVRDGGHTWEYWHSALYNALPYFSRNFNK